LSGLFNIGAARMAVLRSWGVETAAEIEEEKVGSIPGFGRNLTERLVNWREGLEQRFRFEPAAVTDPRDVQRIDRELAARRTRYMKELRPAILTLEKRINDIGDERRALWQRLETAFNDRMLAEYIM
jgi:DNA-binding helix-hairpin-helix protein with protein kinase domain